MVDGCKNRNRLSPQIAVVVRSSWPCHRFAVYIGAEMLHEEGPTFCQRRWHRRETVHELHCLLNDALARWGGYFANQPPSQPVQLCEVLWQPLPRATSGPWMKRLC